MKVTFKGLAIGLLIFFLIPALAFGWSSQDDSTAYGLAGTHQFMCKAAHVYFKEHPAAQFYDFPGIEAIISYSGVNTSQEGNGPDNPQKSFYSEHWYNPSVSQDARGKAGVSTQDYHAKLMKTLRELSCTDDGDAESRNKLRQEAAEYAAYGGHYIQDMTCPFHLIGMPKNADRRKAGDERITGPFRKFDQALWERAVKESNKDKSERSDWFDPSFYDGIGMAPGILSSHVLYEALVEINFYLSPVSSKAKLWSHLRTDYAQKLWHNGMPLKDYVQAIALDVRGRVDARDPALFVDSRQLQQQFESVQTGAAEYLRSTGVALLGLGDPNNNEKFRGTVYQTLKALTYPVPMPFREWAEGTQATYVAWRSAFCAAVIKKQNIMLIKVPNEAGAYGVKVKVSNLEPEEGVSAVHVAYKVKDNGQVLEGGSANTGTIPAANIKGVFTRLWQGDGTQEANDFDEPVAKRQEVDSSDSDWIEIPGTFRIEGDLRESAAAIRFAVKASYSKVPDSGMSVVQYNIKDLATDAKKLPDMRNTLRDGALNTLSSLSSDFQVREETVEAAPKSNLESCVKEQVPAPGTWVSPTDTITLFEYDAYSQVTVRGRVRDLISRKGLGGVIVQVNVGGYSAQTSTGNNGAFEMELALTPQIVRGRVPATVTIQKDGYMPYRNFLNLSEEWNIEMRPSVKPEFEVRIENPKIVQSDIGPVFYSHWFYETVVKVKKVGVYFTKMDIRDNTFAGDEFDKDVNVRFKAGEEYRLRCRSGDAGDINNVVKEITLRGMDDNGAPAQLSFTFRSDKKMVDKISQNQNMQTDALVKQYLEAYKYRAGGYNLDAYEVVVPIEEAYKGQDHLVFVKALCESKKNKFLVSDARQFDYEELNKIMNLVQFYLNKTARSGDRRYEEKAVYILRFLVPAKKFCGARVPAWQGISGDRAIQLVPEFFGNYN